MFQAERENVVLSLPMWLLDEVHDVLRERAGRIGDGELEAAIQEHVERFLERAVTGGLYGTERAGLLESLRAVRARQQFRREWKCAADLLEKETAAGSAAAAG